MLLRIAAFVGCLAVVLSLALPASAENEGIDSLDKATELKLDASTDEELAKVIELCEKAIELGLDDGNKVLANKLLAAAAYQRAEAMLQQLPRYQNNRNAFNNLRRLCIANLEKAVAAKANFPEAWTLLAQVEFMNGQNRQKALAHLDKAVEYLQDKPVDLSKTYVMRALLRTEDDDRLAELQLAIEADPSNIQAWQAKIELQRQNGNLQEAMEDAKKLLAKDASNEFAISAVVESLIGLNQEREAIDLVTARIEEAPDNGMLYRNRALAYRSISLDPDLSEEENNAARDSALADLNKAIEIDSRDAIALIKRGEIYFDMEENEKAREDISSSLLIEPNSIEGVLYRSLVAASQGRYDEAIEDMRVLVRFAPSNAPWVRQLAHLYHLDNRPREAIDLLDVFLKSNPKDWRGYRIRGDASLSISEHQNAIADYETALKVIAGFAEDSPEAKDVSVEEHAGVLNNYSWLLATSPKDEVRNGKRALELGLKACELTEYKLAHILSTLAAAYAETGDFENARKWSSEAVKEGAKEDNPEQQVQLEKELESYKADKPWREQQEIEENELPLNIPLETIDT
ncbi:MAG: tetratricopeptide repeat protein [Planctomycetales bacterium]|nr:tetratricopeptide repeat protein [Planctomycetales bacterium]